MKNNINENNNTKKSSVINKSDLLEKLYKKKFSLWQEYDNQKNGEEKVKKYGYNADKISDNTLMKILKNEYEIFRHTTHSFLDEKTLENAINSIKNSILNNVNKIYADSKYLKSVSIPYEISQYDYYYDALVFEAISQIAKNKSLYITNQFDFSKKELNERMLGIFENIKPRLLSERNIIYIGVLGQTINFDFSKEAELKKLYKDLEQLKKDFFSHKDAINFQMSEISNLVKELKDKSKNTEKHSKWKYLLIVIQFLATLDVEGFQHFLPFIQLEKYEILKPIFKNLSNKIDSQNLLEKIKILDKPKD